MTVGTLLQTIISLVFIYLILALLTSEIQEYLATIFEARAKRLKESIRQMLGEDRLKLTSSYDEKRKEFGQHFQVFVPEYELCQKTFKAEWLTRYCVQHESVIKKRGENWSNKGVWIDEKGSVFTIKETEKIFDENNKKWIGITGQNTEVDRAEIKQHTNDADPNDPEKARSRKFQVYQQVDRVIPPLEEGDWLYVDDEGFAKPFPSVDSLTEKLYAHPKIVALNQTAFRWVSFLGISWDYPSWNQWKTGDKLNFASTISFILLLMNLIVNLLFTLPDEVKIFFFIFFGIVCLLASYLNYQYSQKNPSSRDYTRRSVGPSYIDNSDLFVEALMDILKNESLGEISLVDDNGNPISFTYKDRIIQRLNRLKFYTPAQTILIERVNALTQIENETAFQEDLKKLYEEVQKRSSGVYKRNAKGLSFIVGLLIAIVANADTFHMVTSLSKEKNEFSNNLVTQIQNNQEVLRTLSRCTETESDCWTDENKNKLQQLIEDSGTLPIGWNYNDRLDLQKRKVDGQNQIQEIDSQIEKKKAAIETDEKLVDSLTSTEIKNACEQPTEGDVEPDHQPCLQQLTNTLFLGDQTKVYSSDSPADRNFQENLKKALQDATELPRNYTEYIAQKREEIKTEEKELISLFMAKVPEKTRLQDELDKIEKELENLTRDRNDLSKQPLDIFSWGSKIESNVRRQGGWPQVLLGWWISAIALSMGAPFWFDLLNRVMNVRNAAKSTDPASGTGSE